MKARLCSALVVIAALASVPACVVSGRGAPRANKPVTSSTDFSRSAVFEKINADQLDLLANAYADRYRTLRPTPHWPGRSCAAKGLLCSSCSGNGGHA